MKRFISCLVAVLLAISCLCFSSSAEGNIKISVGNVVTAGGGSVGVPVEIENNSGLWGLVFNVRYDTRYFKYSEVRNNAEVFENSSYMIGPKDPSVGYVRVLITPSNTTENNVKNGKICTIYFEVLKDTPDGDYPLTLEIDSENVIDVGGNEVEFSLKNGSVTVNSDYSEEIKTTAAKNNGDIIATTASTSTTASVENQKTEKNKSSVENKTEISEAFVTDKAGEPETDSKGERITEKVVIDKETGEIIEKYEENGETGTDYSIIFIIIACVFTAFVIVATALFIKKRKKK